MAVLFDDGDTEYWEAAGTCGLSGFPFSMAARCRTDAYTNQAVVSFGDTDADNYAYIRCRDPADNDVIFYVRNGGAIFAATSTQYPLDTWFHVAVTADAGGNIAAYLNGGGKGVNAGAAWSSLDNTTIGTRHSSNAYADYFSGDIAEAAIWNVALTDADVAMLATGVLPWKVKPANIVAYYAMHTAAMVEDLIGGYDMLPGVNGPSSSGVHPPMIYPASAIFVPSFAAAPPAGNPWYYYQQQMAGAA